MSMISLVVLAGSLFLQSPDPNIPGAFLRQHQVAQENRQTPQGAEFDSQLRAYLASVPGLAEKVSACRNSQPLPHRALGYVEFGVSGAAELVLAPENDFTRCVVAAHAGLNPPAPPRLPYANQYDFN